MENPEIKTFDDGSLCHEPDDDETITPKDILAVCQRFSKAKGVEVEFLVDYWRKIGLPSAVNFERELNEVSGIQRQRDIGKRLHDWVLASNGWFYTSDVYQELGIQRTSDKNLVRPHLARMVSHGILERGDRNGKFRRVITGETDLIIPEEVPQPLPLKWPCGVEEYCNILPKSVVVVAGSQNSGKTAYCLNAAYENRDGPLRVFYFSSEMGSEELRVRLEGFPYPISNWSVISFKLFTANLNRIVRPNAFNIVDFLQTPEGEFYKMGFFLEEIHRSLTTGVALVAMQKPPNSSVAWGGYHTMVIPRIYLTLDRDKNAAQNILKIEKGKLWASPTNPNGLRRYFKLVKGAQFRWTTPWER